MVCCWLDMLCSQRLFTFGQSGAQARPVSPKYTRVAESKRITDPHNHKTWGVVVGIEGQELEINYDRRVTISCPCLPYCPIASRIAAA